MAEYFRKPTEVDAFKYGYDEWPEWFHEMIQKREASYPYKVAGSDDPYGTDLKTSFGTLRVEYGDYIVRDAEGDVFPMKPYNFIKSHEIDTHTIKRIVYNMKKCDYRCEAGPLTNNGYFQQLADIAGVDITRELLRRGYSK